MGQHHSPGRVNEAVVVIWTADVGGKGGKGGGEGGGSGEEAREEGGSPSWARLPRRKGWQHVRGRGARVEWDASAPALSVSGRC